jgi:hypothetical protein
MNLPDNLSDRGKADRDGLSPETAIIVRSIAEEYQWIQHNCPGFTLLLQGLKEMNGKHYDYLTLCAPDGEEREVYFDISEFFGKGKGRAPGPPCPYCGAPLRTDKAKQCFNCGMDWHDPANVVSRRRT